MQQEDLLIERIKTLMAGKPPEEIKKEGIFVSIKIRTASGKFVFLNHESYGGAGPFKDFMTKLKPLVFDKSLSLKDSYNARFVIPARESKWEVLLNNQPALSGSPKDIYDFFNYRGSLFEAVYDGNIGLVELMKFYKVATPEQKKHLEDLVITKSFRNCL